MDKIRVGVLYFSAGQRVAVEVGSTIIGHTSQDAKGNQVYWFKSVADFERMRKDLFEANNPLYKPIPCFEMVEQIFPEVAMPKPLLAQERINPLVAARDLMAPALPPPPPLPSNELPPDEIFIRLAGRKPRIQEFAAELGMDPERLKAIIAGDPRYAPVVGGWVRAAGTE